MKLVFSVALWEVRGDVAGKFFSNVWLRESRDLQLSVARSKDGSASPV